MAKIDAHNREIHANIANWNRKPLLRQIYRAFYEAIQTQLSDCSAGLVVELGSGVADITEVIHNCVRTDLFKNPWIDQVENAYKLSFDNQSVSNLILFDVFHHLRYPGTALNEFFRVLTPTGRVIIFEPCLSALGFLVFGLLHKEPLGLKEKIHWNAPSGWSPEDLDYYAAQGNATRVFVHQEVNMNDYGWKVITVKRFSSISYVASGGYTKPQMYPTCALPIVQKLEKSLNRLPRLFGTRLLVVLEKANR